MGLKQIRMGKPANHMHETWPNPSQLAGAYHCGSLFRLGLVLHLAAGQCLRDVLRVADCRWRCFRFETCLVERKTEGLKVKHHQSSWTINKHQPSTMMLKDLFPTLAHGHQHGLFFRGDFRCGQTQLRGQGGESRESTAAGGRNCPSGLYWARGSAGRCWNHHEELWAMHDGSDWIILGLRFPCLKFGQFFAAGETPSHWLFEEEIRKLPLLHPHVVPSGYD